MLLPTLQLKYVTVNGTVAAQRMFAPLFGAVIKKGKCLGGRKLNMTKDITLMWFNWMIIKERAIIFISYVDVNLVCNPSLCFCNSRNKYSEDE